MTTVRKSIKALCLSASTPKRYTQGVDIALLDTLDLKHTLSIFEVLSGSQISAFNYRLQEHKRGHDPPETSPKSLPPPPSFQVEISSRKPKEARLTWTNKSHSAGRPCPRVPEGAILTISLVRAITAALPQLRSHIVWQSSSRHTASNLRIALTPSLRSLEWRPFSLAGTFHGSRGILIWVIVL